MADLTVELHKDTGDSLGIGFRTLTKPPHCEISILVSDGVAAKSGLVHEGDLLLTVNGINVRGLSPSEVGGVLARHSTDSTITLQLHRDAANGSISDLDATDDLDIDTPDTPEEQEPIFNGHPTIIVEAVSPPLSPEGSTPVTDGPPELNAPPMTGWRGPRQRHNNPIAGILPMPEIQEATDGTNKVASTLIVQAVVSKRHSITPGTDTDRKSAEDVKRNSLRSSKSLDLANLPQWRANTIKSNVTLHNLLDGSEMSDRLHSHAIKVNKTKCARWLLICWVYLQYQHLINMSIVRSASVGHLAGELGCRLGNWYCNSQVQ